jgi:long-chain acyl-CoA synthetase
MSKRPWLDAYPPQVPKEIDPNRYRSLRDLMEDCFERYRNRCAYRFLGSSLSYGQLDEFSLALAAYLQSLGLAPGDRVALMMPNIPQYPIAVAAVLRAGLVVVNVNPLYTAHELEHQLQDCGAKAIIIIENFAATLQKCRATTPIQHVVLCAMGDRLGWFKAQLVNWVVRRVKKLVPAFQLAKATPFNQALRLGQRLLAAGRFEQPALGPDDIALLQYTGGTTGLSKGAVLLHRNLVANALQSEAWNLPALQQIPADQQPTLVCALPLYHIFAFTVNMMLGLRTGSCNILIPNPRDLKSTLQELSRHRFHSFPAVNTLFNGLLNHPDFKRVDWSHLRVSLGGGMAVQRAVAERWLAETGCPICEGYGLSETSPTVCCNPVTNREYTGTIGLPLPNTELKCLDEDGGEVPAGQAGEIAIRGPQVMAGYWQQPAETARVMTADGYLRSGDIGIMDERGYFRIVDRKKDMILVSGFNVYPNEVEDVIVQLPGVSECAVVGIPDEKMGEAVKLVVVPKDSNLNEQAIRAHCKTYLTAYKCPRIIEFRKELPKTPVGKILRRALRDSVQA